MFTFGGVDKTQYRFPDLHECAKGERGPGPESASCGMVLNAIDRFIVASIQMCDQHVP